MGKDLSLMTDRPEALDYCQKNLEFRIAGGRVCQHGLYLPPVLYVAIMGATSACPRFNRYGTPLEKKRVNVFPGAS